MINEIEIFKNGILQTVQLEVVNITQRIILTERIKQAEANHELFNLDWYKSWKNSEKTGWAYDGQLCK